MGSSYVQNLIRGTGYKPCFLLQGIFAGLLDVRMEFDEQFIPFDIGSVVIVVQRIPEVGDNGWIMIE